MQKKINVSLDDKLIELVDSKADEMYMTRSGYISYCITQQLKGQDLINSLITLTNAYEEQQANEIEK